jgi:hypothetical protein
VQSSDNLGTVCLFPLTYQLIIYNHPSISCYMA